nr:MAG TPA: hypothetical protein [Caudoviricetes sp.]
MYALLDLDAKTRNSYVIIILLAFDFCNSFSNISSYFIIF